MLLLGDIGLGLLLTVTAMLWRVRAQGKRAYDLSGVATTVLASFGLAVLLFEGMLPGFWMIVGYSLYGGFLEDHLLPGATLASLLRTLAIGLLLSTYVSIATYIRLLPRRKR